MLRIILFNGPPEEGRPVIDMECACMSYYMSIEILIAFIICNEF